jgi:hypothetical protein
MIVATTTQPDTTVGARHYNQGSPSNPGRFKA